MDHAFNMSVPPYPKRPGSPLGDQSMPAAKMPRMNSSQLQINYLVRQKQDILPLVTVEERMPRVLQLIGEYDGVLQRHESMAGNLGACPLGPILLKRFERLFDGPPRVLKSHAKDPLVTWLDVVEFAQNRPEQFNLEKQRNGVRVCQFYHKQCRVEISEEDYVLIASGMPQKLIPPQPILEDEEKELGVMEILERNLAKVVQSADQVSARARQLNHKLKNRRSAILARRETEGETTRPSLVSNDLPLSPMDLGAARPIRSIEIPSQSQSPPLGFTAVNVRQSLPQDADGHTASHTDEGALRALATINGRSTNARADNLSKFLTESERNAGITEDSVRRSSLPQLSRDTVRQVAQTRSRQEPMSASAGVGYNSSSEKGSPSVAIPSTPASLLPPVKPNTLPKDDGGPYKAEMVARMENMQRGERIIPPCDRCRRLQMDCMKNLTACQGCTKKHAKCSWKDVSTDELRGHAAPSNMIEHSTNEAEPGSNEPSVREWGILLKDKDRNEPRPPEQRTGADEPAKVKSPTSPGRGTGRGGSGGGRVDGVTATRRMDEPSVHDADISPKLDVRPPPLEQQIRDAADGKHPHTYSNHQHGQYTPSYGETSAQRQQPSPQSQSQAQPHSHSHSHSHPHSYHHMKTARSSRGNGGNNEAGQDQGDRLAELAQQIYRSTSQSIRPPSSNS